MSIVTRNLWSTILLAEKHLWRSVQRCPAPFLGNPFTQKKERKRKDEERGEKEEKPEALC
jgi:hypothetical protein